MLNTPASAKATWLKYPVFFITALTVASAFAKPQHIKALGKYGVKPVVDALEAVVVRAKKPDLFVIQKESFVVARAAKTPHAPAINHISPTAQPYLLPDSSHIQTISEMREKDVQLDNVVLKHLDTTFQVIDDKEMEALVLAGQYRYGHLGIGPRRFDKEEIKKQSSPGSYLKVSADGALSVNERAAFAKVFINNEPVTPQAVRSLTIDQIYTLAVIYGNKAVEQDQVSTRYILFYVNKGK